MNPLDFYFPEWAFVALSFAILVFALTKILWKPVMTILTERQANAARALEQIASVKSETEKMDRDRIEYTAELERQTLEQMKDARTRAGREYDRIIAEAESKARSILESARVQAEHEGDMMRNALEAEAVAVAIDAASKFLVDKMSADSNEGLILDFIEEGAVT
ncbi:MAG: ATP synthase F0 subunit B [Oscillospiraceae bacterium]|jgi:F-type H+-transporting ATPase subunit b|nr:ATP synthase F0 subunit B [Oscillospiraceae bacterium]